MANAPIKVLIVDDSAVLRQVLAAKLAEDPGIEVMRWRRCRSNGPT